MNYDFHDLDWDTEHFGIKSGKVTLKKEITSEDLSSLKLQAGSYDFVVISNVNNNPVNNYLIGSKIDSFLVDVNIQFTLNPDLFESHTFYPTTNMLARNEKLLSIAEESFNFSRFFNDPYLNKDLSRIIYKNWVSNSFNKVNKYFILAKEEEVLLGFVLFSFNENKDIVIELISLTKESQGKGTGTKLISTLIDYAKQSNVKNIKVGTQIDNLQAINFYTKKGFSVTEKSSIYHYWPRKGSSND